MNRYLTLSIAIVSLSTLAIPLRAAKEPRAGKMEKTRVLWTNEDVAQLSRVPGLISVIGQPMNEVLQRVGAPAPQLTTEDPAWYAAQAASPNARLEAEQAKLRDFTQALASAEQATQALYEAVQNDNEQAILQILGGRKELASSGDGLEDKVERQQFATKYQQMHRLVRQSDGSMALYIGAENWPFPAPLISEKGKWRFDADAGTQEIFFRRIGENEAVAIQTCHTLVRAITGDTGETASNDPLTRYAQTLVSTQAADVSRTRANAQGASAPFDGYHSVR
jgi:hypothetical protein